MPSAAHSVTPDPVRSPSLAASLAGLSAEDQARIRWQLRRAAEARADVEKFFQYVIREEITQQPVAVLPHQSLFFRFREHHKRCVVRMPVGFSKTFSTATYLLHGIGHDPFMRSAVISSTLDQAQKPLLMCRFYIEESPELRLVFPKLRPTQREGEAWTQSKFVVDRPGILRDPTLVAIGQDSGRLPGSRLKWIGVDDILSVENSRTEAQRKAVIDWFGAEVISRLDKEDPRVCVTNTPRDPKDLTYFLEKERGWPTMTMDAFGDIRFANTDFDCDLIRPTYVVPEPTLNEPVRLVANDKLELAIDALDSADPKSAEALRRNPESFDGDRAEVVPLWPARWSHAELVEDRSKANNLRAWNQTMRCVAVSDEDSRLKQAWVERAQQLGRDLGFASAQREWAGSRCFTGVDLAIGKKKVNGKTCLFTIHVNETGIRCVLKVDSGRWSGREILDRLIATQRAFGSIVRIESNAAQLWMKEWALELDASLPVRAHYTGQNKHDLDFGVESVFADFENGLWAVPTGDPGVDSWLQGMYEYDPEKHTPDELMASWFAREQARQSGAFASARMRRRGKQPGSLQGLLAR